MHQMIDTRQKKHILIVEDSKDIGDLLGTLLENEGYQVILTQSGEEGLEQASLCPPHLILMDVALPGINGWEVVSRLRQSLEFLQTPILAVTAYASEQDEERALAVGCTAYLSKPFDITVLLRRIAELVPA